MAIRTLKRPTHLIFCWKTRVGSLLPSLLAPPTPNKLCQLFQNSCSKICIKHGWTRIYWEKNGARQEI